MGTLVDIVIVLVPLVLSLSIHEYAHAWSAFKLGDDTASRQGRLTLDPFAHIDLIGTIVVPVVAVIYGGFALIGWAKPVPVSPHRFSRKVTMRRGMIITALAGPFSNLILAFLAGGIVMGLFSDVIELVGARSGLDRFSSLWLLGDSDTLAKIATALEPFGFSRAHQAIVLLLSRLCALNIALAVFNMLPVSPLDGSRLLPEKIQMTMARHPMLVLLGLLLFINVGGHIIQRPVWAIGNGILGLWALIF